MYSNLTVPNIIKLIHQFKPIDKLRNIKKNKNYLILNFSFVDCSEYDKYALEIFYSLGEYFKHVILNLKLDNKSYKLRFPIEDSNKITFYLKNKKYSLSNYFEIDDLFFVGFISKIINCEPKYQNKEDMVFLKSDKLKLNLANYINNLWVDRNNLDEIINNNIKKANVQIIPLSSENIYFEDDMIIYEHYINNGGKVSFNPLFIKTKKDFGKNGFKNEVNFIITDMRNEYKRISG